MTRTVGFELPDGRLKLIDGHLRRDIDMDVEVEVGSSTSARRKPASFS